MLFVQYTQLEKGMKKQLVLLIVGILFCGFLNAQTTLQGKVTDADSGEPAELATIKIFKGGALVSGTQTDFDGNYSVSNIDPGTYTVEVSYVGYNNQRIEGVVVKIGKTNFVNVKLSQGKSIDAVDIVAYKVPLIEQDNTTQGSVVTAEQIKNLPQRNLNAIIATTAGVSSGGEGGNLNIRGSRTENTVYFLDGIPISGNFIPVWDLEQVQVITGGVGAEFGDLTGGAVSGTTKGPSSKYAGGLDFETSTLFDQYNYNLLNANISGPLLRKKDTKETILGFRLSGSYNSFNDDDPSYVGIYQATDAALERLSQDPITRLSNGTLVNSADFLKESNGDVVLRKARPNQKSNRLDGTGRLDWRVNKAIDVSLIGTLNSTYERFDPSFSGNIAGSANYVLLNSQNNPEAFSNRYRVNLRLRHRLGRGTSENAEEAKAQLSSIRNASYTLQGFYQWSDNKTWDPRHEDRFWDYGNVGSFNNTFNALIGVVDNPDAPNATKNAQLVFSPLGDTLFWIKHLDNTQGFAGANFANSKNPGLARYNKLIQDPVNIFSYNQWNGQGIEAIESSFGFHSGINTVFNSYQKGAGNRRTFQGSVNFDFLPGGSEKGKHSIQVGVLYEERLGRSWNIAPRGLWNLGRLLENGHIAGVDTVSTGVKIPVDLAVLFPGSGLNGIVEVDSLGLILNQTDGVFYKELRKTLGVGLNQYTNLDALDPGALRLDMFSARELNDQGLISYFGYDYLGNNVASTVRFDDFFTSKVNGIRNHPVAADRPIYGAAYIQDKFTYKDIIFRLGLRADIYDINTKVMKDPYSLYEVKSAKEFYAQNPGLQRPAGAEDDFKVYTTSGSETAVKAFRRGDTWYDSQGRETDGQLVFGTELSNPVYKDDRAEDAQWIQSETFDVSNSFTDYKRQVNLMPRLAFSFPISDDANFFAHYDVLVQRPTSNTIATARNYFYFMDPNRTPENNPNLKPEKTIDYEVGFQQKLTNSSAIKISAYYKELRDNIQRRTLLFIPVIAQYDTYDNIDFGTVKGFSATYDLRRTNNIQVGANYTLQFADGTGSDANSSRGLTQNGNNIRTLFPLSFDERHTLNLQIDYRYGAGKQYNGPRIFGVNIFEETGLNIDARMISGRPYTEELVPQPRGSSGFASSINGARLPWKAFLNARVDRNIKIIKSKSGKNDLYVNVYFRAQNILNLRTVIGAFKATGSPDDDGFLVSSIGKQRIIDTGNAGQDVAAFLDSYQWYALNPDFFALPRRLYLGATFQF